MTSEKTTKKGDTDSQSDQKGGVKALTENIFTDDAVDPIYQAKARILNDALQEIGMGRYQWWVPEMYIEVLGKQD